ncbi:MAG: ATP-binding protein [Waddliaceae bacterium]
MIKFITETYHRLIEELEITTQRYLYPIFSLKDRLTGLVGPRGVGKTTLLLQYIKNELYSNKETFYFSADSVYFDSFNLVEFVSDLYAHSGYKMIFIDEIHKYPNWNQELKNIYDSFPKLGVVFSGSSMLDLVHGSYDLSRRAVLYHLKGMSFREYLNFHGEKTWDPITWEDLLSGKATAPGKVEKLKPIFQQYLEMGYYPFVEENPLTHYEKLRRVVDKAIYEDIANYYNLKTPNLQYFKKILSYLSNIPPGEVSTTNLGGHLGIDHKTAAHYLQILNDVGLVRMVYPQEGGSVALRKPAKVFLNNTTLLYAMEKFTGATVSKDTERELFFYQSVMDAGKEVFFSKVGDFSVENSIFEIGGKKKRSRQIKEALQSAYLVKDDILYPYGKSLPLHYFGFLY